MWRTIPDRNVQSTNALTDGEGVTQQQHRPSRDDDDDDDEAAAAQTDRQTGSDTSNPSSQLPRQQVNVQRRGSCCNHSLLTPEMDPSEKERLEKAALRKRRQQGVAAGTSRFAELEQAVQEIRMNTLQVLKTPYYRNCKSARNIRRGMRVIRELCKQMRSETVTIGKERKEKGEGKRRKMAGAPDAAGMASGSGGVDTMVGGSPAVVNFVLLAEEEEKNNNNSSNPPVITELSDSP